MCVFRLEFVPRFEGAPTARWQVSDCSASNLPCLSSKASYKSLSNCSAPIPPAGLKVSVKKTLHRFMHSDVNKCSTTNNFYIFGQGKPRIKSCMELADQPKNTTTSQDPRYTSRNMSLPNGPPHTYCLLHPKPERNIQELNKRIEAIKQMSTLMNLWCCWLREVDGFAKIFGHRHNSLWSLILTSLAMKNSMAGYGRTLTRNLMRWICCAVQI